MKKQIFILLFIILFSFILYFLSMYVNIESAVVFFTFGLIVTSILLYNKYSKLHKKMEGIERKIFNQVKESNEQNYYQLESILSLQNFINPVYPLPKSRKWAASPDYLKLVYQIIRDIKPKVVVEAGSGLSSLIIGYSLKQLNNNGKLYSLEDKMQFAKESMDHVEKHDLGNYVEVIYAPIEEYDFDESKFKWYNISAIEQIKKIDVLVLDGPAGSEFNVNPRYGALPLLYEKLSKNILILLDDGNRMGEKKAVESWVNLFDDLTYEYIDLEKGAFLLKRNKVE